ncbi:MULTISPECIES: FHA domain-containing protein [Isoptericola]|uniref:FHA domain-containing protein n=1 Tax=Isoptericola sediminis TaxID=2733572 RepID=A0A849JSP3_9MICO|nr:MULTISPECIES: FHA domain-containing protein [Isoptericola]MDO8144796.1 FHA domain-containing protein [Isoptericola sp. 178]MDO8149576.1 FHA domain-containing protein [Isoptericola sp. b515]MDO8152510.1 FHA domain-containing protein [Isoptericola sp. b408]NNU26322.1 FHA domain-containing protein [Isoptericola sediminis]
MTDPRSTPRHEAGADTTAHLGRIGGSTEEQTPRVPLTAEESAAVSALPRHSALLVVQYGSGAVGERFLLDTDRAVAGRSEHADIFLDDVTVSRKHAEFVREGDRFVVRDIGSLNGTYLNRERIDAAVLTTGDEVQIGKFRMSFHASPQAPRDLQAPAS